MAQLLNLALIMLQKRTLPLYAALVALVASTTGCRMVGGIFKAGLWMGVLGIVLLGALLFGAARLITGRST